VDIISCYCLHQLLKLALLKIVASAMPLQKGQDDSIHTKKVPKDRPIWTN